MGFFSSDEWCEYCKGRTNYKCWASGEPKEIPEGYLKWYCGDSNVAYSKCELYPHYVVSGTCEILNIGMDDQVRINNTKLVEEILKKDERYSTFSGAYNKFGLALKSRMKSTLDVQGMAKDTYSRLEKISKIIDEGDIDLAAWRYIMLTLRLMSLYGFKCDYKNYKAKKTNYDQKEFAKEYHEHVKKYSKTLD